MRVGDVAMAGNICQALPGTAGMCLAWRRAASVRRRVGVGEAAGEERRKKPARESTSWHTFAA